MVNIACINMTSSNVMDENIEKVSVMIHEAAAEGAEFIFTPECVALMSIRRDEQIAHFYTEETHPALRAFKQLARDLGVWISVGSLSVAHIKGDEKATGRSFVISHLGEIVERYDKIHLYDVELPNGERYSESRTINHGKGASIAITPWGKLGMSICYDVRFPQLYRHLASQGADFLCVPSAFTAYTGKAHWEILLRARAIENACYVIAANQTGTANGRTTYGHSMIIDPWGTVLANAGEDEGIIYATIDREQCEKIRSTLPCYLHDRDFQHIL